MNLRELLDELRIGILRDTSDQVEGDDPRLWSDERLVRYIDQAQIEFAKTSLVLRSKIRLTTVSDRELYELDPHIISVSSARFLGNGAWVNNVFTLNDGLAAGTKLAYPDERDLARVGHSDIYQRTEPDTRYFDVNMLDTLPPGRPQVWMTDDTLDEDNDQGKGGIMSFKVYPRPSAEFANCTIELRCQRLPKHKLEISNLGASPEVPYQYHLNLLDYAAYKALSIVDHEAGDTQAADRRLGLFKSAAEKARQDVLRKMFTPMGWGFGRNGFTYIGN